MTVYFLSNTPTKGSSHCVQNINIDSFVRLACMESNTSWMPGEGLRGQSADSWHWCTSEGGGTVIDQGCWCTLGGGGTAIDQGCSGDP